MLVSDWSSDVCSSDLVYRPGFGFDGFFNFGTGFVIGSWLNYDMDWGTHRVVYNSWDERGGWRERSEERRVGKECGTRWEGRGAGIGRRLSSMEIHAR